jgi:hypothetical protein
MSAAKEIVEEVTLEQRIADLRKRVAEMELERVKALPFASEAEVQLCVEAARSESEMPEGMNKTFQLAEHQQRMVREARKARKEELLDKKVRGKYQRKAASMNLVSAKYRETGTKGGKVRQSLSLPALFEGEVVRFQTSNPPLGEG